MEEGKDRCYICTEECKKAAGAFDDIGVPKCFKAKYTSDVCSTDAFDLIYRLIALC